MAATPFDVPAPGSAYAFDIYNDAQSHAPRAPAPALPGGPCNYTDSTLPRCGCRRFWSRASLSSPVFQDSGSLAEVCMCSHHACFHEDAQPGHTQQESAMTNAPGQENQKPVVSRAHLSPVQLPSLHAPGSLGSSLDFNFLDFQASLSAARVEAANPSPAGDTHAGQDSPMPDTVTNWEELTRSPAGHARGLPPMPTQCLMSPPPPPSTSASSQARYLRPFAGKGLQTLSGVSAPRPESRRQEHAEQADDPGQAPTEAASTPEAAPSQDRPVSGLETAYQKLSERVDSHEQRLDRLETNSFSVAGHEDCHDRHENIDLRVTELESRVDEVEKILNDNGSVISSRRAPKQDGGGGAADDATASVASVSTNATVLASNRAEVYNQLQQLQAQVNQLQAAALPSYVKPWELEVVFLPFPLKGIWIEAKEFANHRRSTGSNFEGWTQMPNTLSRATPDPQSPKFQEWPGQGPESNWLLPRAFAAGRIIDQRLRSRGLIKTVLVRGPDARSVHLAIHDAFEDVLRISSSSEARSPLAPDYPLTEFLGLRQAWVPLRKLHKDSRLRFLSPAEMATPTLWDFTFLASSVVMKAAGAQRLYITQPEAYLQDHPLGYHAVEAGWTWQKLRQLSRVYPDSQSSADVPEADALEECWNWNDRLDGPPSVPASAISLRQSIHQRAASRRSSTEPSGQFYTGVESPILSTGHSHSHSHGGPSRSRAQSPLIQRDRKGSWPSSIRAGSLPPGAHPALLSPAQSRRRVSSHAALTPYERRSSPFVPRASPRLQSPRPGPVHSHNMPTSSTKRRFASRSPSLAPRNTPRWSRTSMSRSPSLAPGGLYGQNHHHHHRHHHREDENGRERRMTTPFYYATPHSEAVPEFGYHRAGSRGPLALGNGNGDAGLRVYDGYGDEDEDMAEDEGFTTTGSSGDGDEGDSEMTDRPGHPGYHRHSHQNYHHRASGRRSVERQVGNGSFGFGTDGGDDADLDIDVYEDEDEDELDGVDTDAGNITDHHHHPHHPHHPPSRHRRSRSHTTGGGGGVWHGFGRQTPSLASQQQQPLRPEDIPWAGIEDPIANGGIDLEGDSNMSDGENIDPTSQSNLSLGDDDDRGGGQITIHEDDDDDDDDDELGGMEIVGRGQGQGQGQGQGRRKGGKREAENTNNNNNNNNDDDDDDDDDDDEDGDTSSQAPSEYSSKPGPWQIIPLPTTEGPSNRGGGSELDVGMAQKQPHVMTTTRGGSGSGSSRSSVMGFRIHEDGTAGPAGPESAQGLLDTQWG